MTASLDRPRLAACLVAAATLLLLQAGTVRAQSWLRSERVGTTHTITRTVETSRSASNGSSTGSSTDRDTLVERTVAVRGDGVELEYDLPPAATAANRAIAWQFPARVFKPAIGPLQLLNGPELDQRADAWLVQAGLTRAACGHWIFTWNAFQIRCDPQSVLPTLDAFGLRMDGTEGGLAYTDPATAEVTMLRDAGAVSGGTAYAGQVVADPERYRHRQAEQDVAIAEITHKPLTLEQALRARSADTVSVTIRVRVELDAAGLVRQREVVRRIRTGMLEGTVETVLSTEVVTRQP